MSLRDENEAILARLISGELDAVSREGREAMDALGLTSSELDDLRLMAGRLDRAAELLDEFEQGVDQREHPPGLEGIAPLIERLARDAQARRRRRWLVAAAGILMLLPMLLQLGKRPEEFFLGDQGVRVRFVGTGNGRYPAIEFEVHDESLIGERILMVFASNDVTRVTPLFEYPLVTSPWSNPEEQARWPESVHVRIEVRVPGQRNGPYGWAEGSRH